jgi:hypothetical protein
MGIVFSSVRLRYTGRSQRPEESSPKGRVVDGQLRMVAIIARSPDLAADV